MRWYRQDHGLHVLAAVVNQGELDSVSVLCPRCADIEIHQTSSSFQLRMATSKSTVCLAKTLIRVLIMTAHPALVCPDESKPYKHADVYSSRSGDFVSWSHLVPLRLVST